LGGAGGRRALAGIGRWFLGAFFVRYMPLIRFHRFAERPARRDLVDRPPCVFAANHRSWLDALLALALFPRVVVPVKPEYLRIPVLGIAMRWLGCLPLDGSSPATVIAAVAESRRAIESGRSLFVFPEGTRAPGLRLLGFSDVFFRVARDCGVPVVPVLLHSDERYLSPEDERLIPRHLPTWRIRLLEPVEPDRRDRAADIGRQVRRRLTAGLVELDRAAGLDERSSP
jgi:1-acyl-sn-glycerol-3-phosphate acyltransferase